MSNELLGYYKMQIIKSLHAASSWVLIQISTHSTASWALLFEIIATVSQIIAATIILGLSGHEKPHAPLRLWITGYFLGCVATLPFFYWLCPHRHEGVVSVFQEMQIGHLVLSFTRCHAMVQAPAQVNSRLGQIADFIRIMLYFFFITWFVLGFVWICKGSSRADAPILYWSCLSFLITCGLAYMVSFGSMVSLLLCCKMQIEKESLLDAAVWVLTQLTSCFVLEIIATVSQIISATIILGLSVHEKPHAPLRTWIIGYFIGCVATLPFFYWLYPHRHQGVVTVFQEMLIGNLVLSFTRCHASAIVHIPAPVNLRMGKIADLFRIILYFFFITWFVLGFVWICQGSSRADAPILYWSCISFLITSGLAHVVSFGRLISVLLCCTPCSLMLSKFNSSA